jgi:hypothetical protein
MYYTAYAEFCRIIGYQVEETPHGVWIGPSHGFFNRVPLYEMAPPGKDELRGLFRQPSTLGVHYAAEPGSRGRTSHNYFVRRRDYDLTTLNSKGRWSVRKGLRNCRVRPMGFDELQRLGMPLNLDSLARQGRDDPTFSNPDRWALLCQAGEQVDGVHVWGAFCADELAAYIIFMRLGAVVNLIYHNSRADMMQFHPSSALFFSVTQEMMQTEGVEAVYNGSEWLTTGTGLDRFKQRMGFDKEPVVFAVKLRPILKRLLIDWGGRHIIDASDRWFSNREFYQNVRAVLDLAAAAS